MRRTRSNLGLRPQPGTPADRDAVIGLFRRAFGRRLDPRVWQWRFVDNPAGGGIIRLAWDRDVLAGHYALSPVRLRVDERDVPAALSGTTMTHPCYRGRGLFPRLARASYAAAADAGLGVVMGFPNRNSHRSLVRDLGWSDVHEVPTFRAVVRDVGPVHDDPGIFRQEFVDARFDRLWDDLKDTYPVSLVRDRRYLRWRFVDNPGHHYRIFACGDRRSIAGYVVLKRYRQELHITDILCRDAATGIRLVRRAAAVAAGHRLPFVSMWLNARHELHRELERLGFQPEAPVTYFCVLGLGPGRGLRTSSDYRSWYLTMGDSDVY